MIQLSDLLFPTQTNGYHAFILRPHWLALSVIVNLTFFLLAIYYTPDNRIQGLNTDLTIDNIFQLTNQARSQAGVAPLELNSSLNSAAFAKANHMLGTNNFSHFYTNDQQPVNPWQFILGSNYLYQHAGENLARDFTSSQALIQAWITSPSHQQNLLSPAYKDVGIAIVEGSFTDTGPTTLVVQFFASPLPEYFSGQADYQTSFTTTPLITTKPISNSAYTLKPSLVLLFTTIFISTLLLISYVIDLTTASITRRSRPSAKLWRH